MIEVVKKTKVLDFSGKNINIKFSASCQQSDKKMCNMNFW